MSGGQIGRAPSHVSCQISCCSLFLITPTEHYRQETLSKTCESSTLCSTKSKSSTSRNSPSLNSSCITFAQTESIWATLSDRRVSVLTLAAKQTASPASSPLDQLRPLLCTPLSSVLLIPTTSEPFLHRGGRLGAQGFSHGSHGQG